ncbi:hypothetical protein K438DRAFT_1966188 [Mycena galopus ATCC 62051]|nr:hypothetical protein K438DRAFT_1966188 [Mycena galopus ATCC 62051]
MLHFGEFSAWVSIDGTEAPEYGVEIAEDQKSVTCWIASELGKKFSVDWTNKSYSGQTCGTVYMDGNFCGGQIISPLHFPEIATQKGIRHQNGLSFKPFIFSSLELTDDDAFLGGPSHQSLGVIELKILPIEVIGPGDSIQVSSLSGITVHERSKKAVTQQITVADPEPNKKPKSILKTRATGAALANFSFKYRPADILRANGIMPPLLKRKASADPVREQTPDDDDDDAQEEKVLRERLNAIEAKRLKKEKTARIKNEPDAIVDLTQDRKKKVKSESKPEPAFSHREIIDLT